LLLRPVASWGSWASRRLRRSWHGAVERALALARAHVDGQVSRDLVRGACTTPSGCTSYDSTALTLRVGSRTGASRQRRKRDTVVVSALHVGIHCSDNYVGFYARTVLLVPSTARKAYGNGSHRTCDFIDACNDEHRDCPRGATGELHAASGRLHDAYYIRSGMRRASHVFYHRFMLFSPQRPRRLFCLRFPRCL
jgi:hypothetical protein